MLGTTTISVLYTWAYNNTGGSIWSAVFFHWIYTYALDTLGVGMTPPPADYQWLQYVPYILITIVIVVIWGLGKLKLFGWYELLVRRIKPVRALFGMGPRTN
jgi:membrane protease YdiL (CAAX protease family)